MTESELPAAPTPARVNIGTQALPFPSVVRESRQPVAEPLRTEMSAIELANVVRGLFYKDRNYLRLKRRRWSTGAVLIRLVALGLSAASTILLGLSQLTGTAAWGFALSAIVTLVTALEPFFNFRSRWVSADEALARWHRAEEELSLYAATTAESDLEIDEIIKFDQNRRDEWARFSQDWLSDRRSAGIGPDA